MKRLSVALATILSFLCHQSMSQNLGGCGTISSSFNPINSLANSGCQNVENDWIAKYRTPQYWIPNNSTPIKTILINYIVCQDNNGNNGWQDSQIFRDQVDQMFIAINNRYSNSQPKGYPLTCEPTLNYIADTRIRHLLNDSDIVNPFDSVTAIIKYEQIPDQKCRLVSAYIAKGDLTRADSTLSAIEAEQISGLDNLCQLLRILIELRQSLIGCWSLHSDSVKTAQVAAIAADVNEKGCIQAQALLMKVFQYFYQEDVVFPDEQNNQRLTDATITVVGGGEFYAFPNPAKDILTINSTDSTFTSELVVLCDMNGRDVISQRVQAGQKSIEVDISALAPGLYMWKIEDEGSVVYVDKFSVIK